MSPAAAPLVDEAEGAHRGFQVVLDNFEGPFDLLLQLISRRKLDVTEIALSQVTDEFIAHVRAAGEVWDLDQTSSFLVVAATLLDLKCARLLPQGEVEDAEDLALLEARDLLFARLLQYRAFKLVSASFATSLAAGERRFARPGGLEPQFAGLLPEVSIPVGPGRLAEMAAAALTPAQPPQVGLEHLHSSTVTVREQAELVLERLRRTGALSFRSLVADADRLTTVVRFLALLELYRNRLVVFEQLTALGELTVRWSGEEPHALGRLDEFDGAPPELPSDQDPADLDNPEAFDDPAPFDNPQEP